jgi:Flp pilus assembly protein protease CpaA
MLLILSHVLAFCSLFIGSLFDLDTTDVPDEFSAIGVVGGILLHAVYSYISGDWSFLGWSLGVGAIFSIVGWGAYYMGGWGGADAFAMSVLGFAAPFVPPAPSFIDPVNLIFNLMIVAFAYTTAYTFYRCLNRDSIKTTVDRLENEKYRVLGEIGVAGLFSAFVWSTGLNGATYFGLLLSLIILYRFFKVVENDMMSETFPVEEVEAGDVAAPGQGFGDKIVGLTEEQLEETDLDEIEIRRGVPFMPVFVIALLITDVFGGGLSLIFLIL